jgi:hypothetical protein
MGNAPEDHLIAIKANLLRPGMFIAALDRLWLHTPFPPGGFHVSDERQIERICRFCTYVYIDPRKCDQPDDVIVPFEPVPTSALAPRVNQHSVGEELPWARPALEALTATVRHMIGDVRDGRLPSLEMLNTGLMPVIESIQRCPDAALWLLRTEPIPAYIYRRSIGTAVAAAVFGHRLGFDRAGLLELALGGILMDIGKLEVPVTILAKPDTLTPREYNLVRKHVRHATEMVRLMDDVPDRVVDMISSHHERFDGSGYPQKLSGTEIPLYARIAGIVDTFDAITQDRRYAPAISAHTALRYLNGQRGLKFDDALLQEFIHAMGVYPTGTWIELLDGSVGMVCSQDENWPLTPRVAIMSGSAGPLMEPQVVLATRRNPIIRARHSGAPGMDTPDLEAIA